MRAIVTSSTLIVVMLLIILTHCTIIGNNVRETEVNTGLKQSMDYAYDKLMDNYIDEDFYNEYNKTVYRWYDDNGKVIYESDNALETYKGTLGTPIVKSDELTDELMVNFCEILQDRIGSDGVITVQLLYTDIEEGTFQIRVIEDFKYPYLKKDGSCMYEKTLSLY